VTRFIVPAVLLIAVEVFVDARFVPTPSVVATGAYELVRSGELWRHLGLTLSRTIAGFGLAAVVGIATGLFLGYQRTARVWFMPSIEVLRAIPGVALLPLAVLWFGLGSSSQIPVIAFAATFPILLNAMRGAQELPPILVRAGRVMELNTSRLFRQVLVPASLPYIFTGLRLSIVYALTSGVGAEIIGGTDGLGFLILDYQRTLSPDKMFATMILVALVGLLLSLALRRAEARLLSYRSA
jgi:ABC-type nitrate/sulfonate/bicarbonate transport system permease component